MEEEHGAQAAVEVAEVWAEHGVLEVYSDCAVPEVCLEYEAPEDFQEYWVPEDFSGVCGFDHYSEDRWDFGALAVADCSPTD